MERRCLDPGARERVGRRGNIPCLHHAGVSDQERAEEPQLFRETAEPRERARSEDDSGTWLKVEGSHHEVAARPGTASREPRAAIKGAVNSITR